MTPIPSLRTTAAMLLAVVAAAMASPPPAGADRYVATNGPRWLVLVDDLHLDFRRTGQIRETLAAAVRPIVLSGVSQWITEVRVREILNYATYDQAEVLFDQAEAVADTEEIRQRVEMARLPVLYLKCKRSPRMAREDGTYDRFCAIAQREGVTHYAEAGEPHRKAFHAEVEAAR